MARIAVYIDYQNVYMRARERFGYTFANEGWHVNGQVRPVAIGLVLRGEKEENDLVSVKVYRGLPSSRLDAKGYGAAQRQISAWENSGNGIVVVRHRPLNYRDPSRPREKGVDVQLAVDFVLDAYKDMYDVGVIFSDDTDLHPALEAVGELKGPGHVKLAAWYDHARGPRIVLSGGEPVPTEFLSAKDYGRVRDAQDYNARSARKPRPPRRPSG